jgi:hypothetical protein
MRLYTRRVEYVITNSTYHERNMNYTLDILWKHYQVSTGRRRVRWKDSDEVNTTHKVVKWLYQDGACWTKGFEAWRDGRINIVPQRPNQARSIFVAVIHPVIEVPYLFVTECRITSAVSEYRCGAPWREPNLSAAIECRIAISRCLIPAFECRI